MNNLKVFRASRNLSGEELARVLGVTPQAYYKIEKGITEIKVKHIKLIRNAYNLSVKEVSEIFRF